MVVSANKKLMKFAPLARLDDNADSRRLEGDLSQHALESFGVLTAVRACVSSYANNLCRVAQRPVSPRSSSHADA